VWYCDFLANRKRGTQPPKFYNPVLMKGFLAQIRISAFCAKVGSVMPEFWRAGKQQKFSMTGCEQMAKI